MTLKKELITKLLALPMIKELGDNKIIVITAAGMFIGTPEIKESDVAAKLFNDLISNLAEDYRKENSIPIDQPLNGNDGCIVLSDVTLLIGNVRNNIPVVTIIFDQIIGISFGNID